MQAIIVLLYANTIKLNDSNRKLFFYENRPDNRNLVKSLNSECKMGAFTDRHGTLTFVDS